MVSSYDALAFAISACHLMHCVPFIPLNRWLFLVSVCSGHYNPPFSLNLLKVYRGDTNKNTCYIKKLLPHKSLRSFAPKWKSCYDAQRLRDKKRGDESSHSFSQLGASLNEISHLFYQFVALLATTEKWKMKQRAKEAITRLFTSWIPGGATKHYFLWIQVLLNSLKNAHGLIGYIL